MTTLTDLHPRIESLRPCKDALEWLETLDTDDPAAAWQQCERGDWLLWVADRAGVDRTAVVAAACDCAELALVHVPAEEDGLRLAIETARAWCRGEATLEEVHAAADVAYVVAYAAYAVAAVYASYAAYARADALRRCADLVRQRITAEMVVEAMMEETG